MSKNYPILSDQNDMTNTYPPGYIVCQDGVSINPIFNDSLGDYYPLRVHPVNSTSIYHTVNTPLSIPSFQNQHASTPSSASQEKLYEEQPMQRLSQPSTNKVNFTGSGSNNNFGYEHDIFSATSKQESKEGEMLVDNSKKVRFNDGIKKIDYILAYEPNDPDETRRLIRKAKRDTFENNLRKIGLELEIEGVEKSADGKTCFTKIHVPWDLLCKCAEEMIIKKPIKNSYRQDLLCRETIYERNTNSWMELGVRMNSIKNNQGTIVVVQEIELQDVDYAKKLTDVLCCGNPCWKQDINIPEEVNCYTAAFRRDRMDKFFFPENKEDFFSSSQRSRVVHRILMKCRYDSKLSQIGINRLISNGSYTSAYPLHEGPYKSLHRVPINELSNERQILYHHWAKPAMWFKEQPLDLIRKYFGEKIGLYFTWLGYYTSMLVPAALMGILVIIYGLCTMHTYEPIVDLCERKINLPMCPKCDKKCTYYPLTDSCHYTKFTYVIDNPFTIVFAVFMSFWATFFLEFWKRKEAQVKYDWDLLSYEDEEEQPRPEFEAAVTTFRINPVTQVEEPYLPNRSVCPRYTVAFNLIIFMVILVILAILSVVIYRIVVYTIIAAYGHIDIGWVNLIASSTAALINLIIIMLLNKLYEKLAYMLTSWEMPKTQTMFDDLFTFKMYLFQFVNFYGSLFYIAFFKLDPGTPKHYNRIFGFRREECNPAGCMFELGLQLFVIMVGKQVFNNFIELILPKVKNWWRRRDNVKEVKSQWSQWEQDYDLVEVNQQGLFYEYLEMVIQYGFITIFVAAFPLGPLFALLNNLTEIRVDAYKFTTIFRRPLGEKTGDIGIWFEILSGVAKISVVVNAFVIAFVSEFIPRLYYKMFLSSDHSLSGFLNSTLSCFDINDFHEDSKPESPTFFQNNSCGFGKQTCRYRGYYHPPYKYYNGTIIQNEDAYEFAPEHWHLIACKLFFVVVFEHFIFAITNLLAWAIPDIPARLATQIKRENYLAKQAMYDDVEENIRRLSTIQENEIPTSNSNFVTC